jgi:hypothetical protein
MSPTKVNITKEKTAEGVADIIIAQHTAKNYTNDKIYRFRAVFVPKML